MFVVFYCFRERYVDDLVVDDAYHDRALFVHEGFDGSDAHARGEDAVVGSRGATALEVTEDRDADVVFGILLVDAVGHGLCATTAFGNDDDTAIFRFAEAVADEFVELGNRSLFFGYNCSLGTRCDGRVEGKETSVATHHFDEE